MVTAQKSWLEASTTLLIISFDIFTGADSRIAYNNNSVIVIIYYGVYTVPTSACVEMMCSSAAGKQSGTLITVKWLYAKVTIALNDMYPQHGYDTSH